MWKKDENFSKFVEFKALVEKEMGKKVKALRIDNGGETCQMSLQFFVQKKAFDEI